LLEQDFASEVTVWSQLRHPNILPFSDVYQGLWGRNYIVSPHLSYERNVHSYLKIKPSTNRTLLALDVAQELKFLHGLDPEIVHAGIKGSSILVLDSGRACLIDFGLTTARDSLLEADDTMSINLRALTRMLASATLEILAGDTPGSEVFTTKSDMYAFGGVCYELFYGREPFHGVERINVIVLVLMWRTSSRIDSPNVDDSMWAFMERCWRKRANGKAHR